VAAPGSATRPPTPATGAARSAPPSASPTRPLPRWAGPTRRRCWKWDRDERWPGCARPPRGSRRFASWPRWRARRRKSSGRWPRPWAGSGWPVPASIGPRSTRGRRGTVSRFHLSVRAEEVLDRGRSGRRCAGAGRDPGREACRPPSKT
jgi:hypothetical protein